MMRSYANISSFSVFSLLSAVVSTWKVFWRTFREENSPRFELLLLLLAVHHHDGRRVLVAVLSGLVTVPVLLKKDRVVDPEPLSHEERGSGELGVNLPIVVSVLHFHNFPTRWCRITELVCERQNSRIEMRAIWPERHNPAGNTWTPSLLWLRCSTGGEVVFAEGLGRGQWW